LCKIQLWPILPENTVGISNYTHGVLEGGYSGGHSAEDLRQKKPNENKCFITLAVEIKNVGI
jgi:hypothetical protein